MFSLIHLYCQQCNTRIGCKSLSDHVYSSYHGDTPAELFVQQNRCLLVSDSCSRSPTLLWNFLSSVFLCHLDRFLLWNFASPSSAYLISSLWPPTTTTTRLALQGDTVENRISPQNYWCLNTKSNSFCFLVGGKSAQ